MNFFGKALVSVFVLVLLLSQAAYAAGPAAVDLGSAGSFTILAKSGISTTGVTSVVGDIGVSPAAASFITGFGLIADASNQFSTSSLLNGKAYASNYAPPTPAKMTTAVGDMQIAYTDAAGRTNPTATELGAGNIGGLTLAPGLYKWGTGVTIPTDVTLAGGANDVWIFQIAQTLNVGNGASVVLSGGAQSQNVFWQVAGQATLGTTSNVKGIILSQTAVVLNTGAILNGRALAQTAVTLDANSVTAPTGTSPAPVTTSTPTPALAPTATPTSTSTPTAMPTSTSTPVTTTSSATVTSGTPVSYPAPDTSGNAVDTASVEIIYGAVIPAAISVLPGTTVTWDNQDGQIHTITSSFDSPQEFSSGNLGGGQNWSHTFSQIGTYKYSLGNSASMPDGVVYVLARPTPRPVVVTPVPTPQTTTPPGYYGNAEATPGVTTAVPSTVSGNNTATVTGLVIAQAVEDAKRNMLIVAGIVIFLAAGLYYYFGIMNK